MAVDAAVAAVEGGRVGGPVGGGGARGPGRRRQAGLPGGHVPVPPELRWKPVADSCPDAHGHKGLRLPRLAAPRPAREEGRARPEDPRRPTLPSSTTATRRRHRSTNAGASWRGELRGGEPGSALDERNSLALPCRFIDEHELPTIARAELLVGITLRRVGRRLGVSGPRAVRMVAACPVGNHRAPHAVQSPRGGHVKRIVGLLAGAWLLILTAGCAAAHAMHPRVSDTAYGYSAPIPAGWKASGYDGFPTSRTAELIMTPPTPINEDIMVLVCKVRTNCRDPNEASGFHLEGGFQSAAGGTRLGV